MGKGGDRNDVATKQGKKAPLEITPSQLKEHRTPDNAWMSIGKKVRRRFCRALVFWSSLAAARTLTLADVAQVYDVSNWHDHPGGSVLFTHAGDDMTDVFTMFHPPDASDWLEQFYVGELVEGKEEVAALTEEEEKAKAEQRDFEKAYRNLRGKMKAAGLFKLSPGFYVYKFVSQFVLVAAAAFFASQPNTLSFWAGAVCLAIFWEQAGWLAHDVCHNQLAQKNGQPFSYWNKALGLMAGNLFQGFSCKWWKDKHNRHHAVPNVHGVESGELNADPDIDTMPLLAWSNKMAALAKESKSGRFMVSIQKFTYLPLLAVARLSWLHQSVIFAWRLDDGMFANATANDNLKKSQEAALKGTEQRLEQGLLVLHHVWVALLCSQRPTLASALAFWFTAQAICGLVLFGITSLGHNGLPVYEANERPDYWKLQVTTTRNISGNAFVHWLCGGLEYQVDHHLFPTMPRHHLPAAHELIVSFCKEHGIKYNEASLLKGTMDVIEHLDVVATEFMTEFPAM